MESIPIPGSQTQAQQIMEYLLSGEASASQILDFLYKRPFRDARMFELLGYRDAILKERTVEFPKSEVDFYQIGSNPIPSISCAIILAALKAKVVKYLPSYQDLPEFMKPLRFSTNLFADKGLAHFEQNLLCFISVSSIYPTFAKLYTLREKILGPTVMDLMPPLLYPTKLNYLVVGCPSSPGARVLAESLLSLGQRGAILCGLDGYSGITITGSSRIIEIVPDSNQLSEIILSAQEVGVQIESPAQLILNLEVQNFEEFIEILNGQHNSTLQKLIAINAAFLLSKIELSFSMNEAYAGIVEHLSSDTMGRFFSQFQNPGSFLGLDY